MTKYLRWTFFSALSGILSGLGATLFLFMLSEATSYREEHMQIIWLLPVVGLFIGWSYYRFGSKVEAGNNLILDEIHNPKNVIPFHMAPFILIGTVLTHLFGGSAGREGTAVQMGASLSDQLSKFFKIEPEERKILLTTGAGAGFGAAIGAPWAGMIFGMEVIHVGRLRFFALPQSFIASFSAYAVTLALGAPHTLYPKSAIPEYALKSFLFVFIAGIFFGMAARIFVLMAHSVQFLQRRFVNYPPLRPFLGGLIIVILYYLEGSYQYAGLGLSVIQNSLQNLTGFDLPLYKSFFTALTVGSGFKGGEFIPLVFIGTSLGSALSLFLPVSFQLLASLGFATVFAAAANTPLACSIMAAEIFGWEIWPYALLSCYVGYLFSGHKSIYGSQIIDRKKYDRLIRFLRIKT